jgi:hypothetical protein
LVEINEYVSNYQDWVETFYKEGLIHSWAELDIEQLVGMPVVREWRQEWGLRGLSDGLIVTPHPWTAEAAQRGVTAPFSGEYGSPSRADLEEMVDGTYGYMGVALSKFPITKWLWSNYGEEIRKHKIKLHGWAQTSEEMMTTETYYSVDSSSWCSFGRWGILYFWNEGKQRLDQHQPQAQERQARNDERIRYFEKRGLVEEAESYGFWEGIQNMDATTMELWNASQWKKLQEHYLKQTHNAYWLTEDEKQEIIAAQRTENGMDASLIIDRGAYDLRPMKDGAKQNEIGRFCNTCVVADKCPAYVVNATCSLSAFRPITSKEDIMGACEQLLGLHFDRVMHAAMAERLQGGFLDNNVTNAMSQFLAMLQQMKALGDNRDEVLIRAKGNGIISQLFGGLVSGGVQNVVNVQSDD